MRLDRPWLLVSIVGALSLDRVLKMIALRGAELPALGGVSFSLVRNTGIAFSLAVPNWLATILIGLSLGIVITIIVQKIRLQQSWTGWGLIVAGGVSNYFDRLRYGSVIDYFRAGNGAINLADVMIIVGIVFLMRRELTMLVRRRYTR